jgi:hypothetical protein
MNHSVLILIVWATLTLSGRNQATARDDWAWNYNGLSARLVKDELKTQLILVKAPFDLVARVDADGFSAPPLVFKSQVVVARSDGTCLLVTDEGRNVSRVQLKIDGALANMTKLAEDGAFCVTETRIVKGRSTVRLIVYRIEKDQIRDIRDYPLPFFGMVVKWKRGVYVLSDKETFFQDLDVDFEK